MTNQKQNEPVWLSETDVIETHKALIEAFGGPTSAVRDANLLGSAIARPRNKWAYEGETRLPELAAAYCFGLVKNHPFIDGNKRAAFLAMALFLETNGAKFTAPEEQVAPMIEGVASGEFDETSVAAWIRDNSTPVGP